MDHLQVLADKASERYLLGEMTEPERFAFEAHYFECAECAEDVRLGAALARGIRAVRREDAALRPHAIGTRSERTASRWWGWLTPAALVPSAVAAMLACVVGYQSLVTIPRIGGPRALTPVVLRAAARGDEQTVTRQPGQPYTALQFDVNAADPGAALRYELTHEGGPVRISGTTTAPPLGVPLQVDAPNSDLNTPGPWTLILRSSAGQEIARYPFQLIIP
jgi:hypothetical protein